MRFINSKPSSNNNQVLSFVLVLVVLPIKTLEEQQTGDVAGVGYMPPIAFPLLQGALFFFQNRDAFSPFTVLDNKTMNCTSYMTLDLFTLNNIYT